MSALLMSGREYSSRREGPDSSRDDRNSVLDLGGKQANTKSTNVILTV